MKRNLIAFIFLSGALFVHGQSTFVWDQQFTGPIDGGVFLTNQPTGQPFTPTQFSMDAAALFLSSSVFGATVDVGVNVRIGSITGTILGTSAPDTVSSGVYDFTFSTPIALTPGTTYYLQPFAISGNGLAELVDAPVPTGQAIAGGATRNNFNFWFQEGITVPEPSLTALFMIGGGIACWHRRKQRVI